MEGIKESCMDSMVFAVAGIVAELRAVRMPSIWAAIALFLTVALITTSIRLIQVSRKLREREARLQRLEGHSSTQTP